MKLLKIILAAVILLTGLLTLNACQTVASPLEDYTWVLTSRTEAGNNKLPLEGTYITVFFDSQKKQFNGSGGCNQYSGTYTVDGLTLTINENIAVTEKWCSDAVNEQERQFIETLKAAVRFEMDHGNLIIYCGKKILNFSRQKP